MKKFICVILVTIAIFIVVGCANQDSPDGNSKLPEGNGSAKTAG